MTTTEAPPVRNADLLNRVATYIERNPDGYAQGAWCKCIAGIAIRLHRRWGVNRTRAWMNRRWPPYTFSGGPGGVAREILGLTRNEADVLFSAYWHPRPNYTVPAVLRMLADGADVNGLTRGIQPAGPPRPANVATFRFEWESAVTPVRIGSGAAAMMTSVVD